MTAPRFVLLAAAALALAACSGDVNPLRDTLVDAGVGAKPRAAPDFVERSRRQDLDYLPIGADPPPRQAKAKTEDEVRRAAADMEETRGRNEADGETARRAATPKPAP